MSSPPEVWLRGPLDGVDPYLMPAAHALTQSAEDVESAVRDLTAAELVAMPGGAASVGFHLRHIAGSIDRLLTYARGEHLTAAQFAALAAERAPDEGAATGRASRGDDAGSLIALAQRAMRGAVDVMRNTPRDALLEPRAVGRAALPSTVLGLLVHVAEHTQRHTGQIITTAKIVRGMRAAGGGARTATIDDFLALDLRVGTVVTAEPFPEARTPAIKLRIDFGPEVGEKRSSAQITTHYSPRELAGRQVVAVVNFPPRRIAGYVSEVLVLGATPSPGDVILLGVDAGVPNGTRIT